MDDEVCCVALCREPVSHRAEFHDLPDGQETFRYCQEHADWARSRFSPDCVEPL